MRYANIALLLTLSHCLIGQTTYDARIDAYRGLDFPCGGMVTPVLRIQNMGSVTMATCVVETWQNGTLNNSFDWILAVPAATGEFRQPALPPVTVAPTDELEFRIISVNDEPDEDAAGNVLNLIVDDLPAFAASHVVLLEVLTDAAPAETSWLLRNHLGQVVATGGPYAMPDAVEEVWLTLPAGQCFALEVNDAGADGMSTGHVKLFSDGVEVIGIGGGDFTDVAVASLETGLTTRTPYHTGIDFVIHPNPTTGPVTLAWSELPGEVVDVRVIDAQGRQVITLQVAGNTTMNLSGLENGAYTLQAFGRNGDVWTGRVLVAR